MLYTLLFMAKDFLLVELFERYGCLLTPHQNKIFADYYMHDLSLGEIAESEGISRQSVLDSVKKAEKQLRFYEQNLRLNQLLTKMVEFSEKLDGELLDEFNDIIKGI